MKLGTQTGSVSNHVMSRMTIGQPVPEVGMGCTILAWTDRYAATVTFVAQHRGQLIVFCKRDKVTVTHDGGGYMGHQDWRTEFDPNGALHSYRQNKKGGWDEVRYNNGTRRYCKTGGYGLLMGRKEEYRDWGF